MIVIALEGCSGSEGRAEVEHVEREEGSDLGYGSTKSLELPGKRNTPATVAGEQQGSRSYSERPDLVEEKNL